MEGTDNYARALTEREVRQMEGTGNVWKGLGGEGGKGAMNGP